MNGRNGVWALLLLMGLVAPAGREARAQQGTGQVVGRVLDAATGRGLAGARVSVQGAALAANAGVDGRYTLAGVPAGTHALAVSLLGYSTKVVTGVQVAPGGSAALDISLVSSALQIEGLAVTAERERGSVGRALDEQRNATGIINATTSEQIARSPDGDAAQAVQRVSGVTVQDGKFVFVRGLGERYTTTSLNGARIPSPEPEKKVVPLDLFPSTLLEAITTSKTFTPDQPGDFSGAQVNLKTRSFPARRTITYSLTGSYNGNATSKDVLFFPGARSSWLANGAADRQLPAILRVAGDFSHLNQGDINTIARSFRNEWSPLQENGPPNLSTALTVGGEDPVFGHRIGYIGSFTYGRGQDVKTGEVRARAVPDEHGNPTPYNIFRGATGTTGVLWGGLLNLSTFLGTDHKLELNNSYNRASDSEAHEDWGSLEEFALDSVRRSSLRYVERSMRSNQLRGEHHLGFLNGADLEWSATASRVTRDEPDRADLAYGVERAPTGERLPLAWLGYLAGGARRTFAGLEEDSYNFDGSLALPFGASEHEGRIKVGGAFRRTARDASAQSYDLRSVGLTQSQRAAAPEEIFDGRYSQGSEALISVEPNVSGGTYDARDRVAAGFAMAEYLFGRFKVIGGARVERWNLDLSSEPTSGGRVLTERTNTDVLPSLAVNVRLSDVQSLRFSASQTLSRPEYRELSPISSLDMIGGRQFFGDSSLVRTLVQNYDARWEMYPSSGEVLSFGVFAKRFKDPIEQIEVATSGATQLSFTNAESAFNFGAEVEVRKELGSLWTALEPFSVFTNATLMKSRISTANSELSAATRDNRPMVGQAPYVINAGVAYASAEEGGASATLLYNVVGKRLFAAALEPLNADAYEMPRHVLDLSLRLPLFQGVSARVDAENLLDAASEVKQGDVVRERYKTGRTVAFGVTWRP